MVRLITENAYYIRMQKLLFYKELTSNLLIINC